MAKKKNNAVPPQLQDQGAAPASAQDFPPQPEAAAPAREPASKAQVLSFWGAVLAVVFAAWALAYFMPGVRERDIERWLMLPFGLFLVYNLYRLR